MSSFYVAPAGTNTLRFNETAGYNTIKQGATSIQGDRTYPIVTGIFPIAWYKFDDITPATFNDASGNGVTLS